VSALSELIEEVRKDVQIPDDVVSEARDRRDAVLTAAAAFADANRTFGSGSLAHRTAIAGVGGRGNHVDADGAVVINRRRRPELGPDGDGVGPAGIAEEVRTFVRPRLRETYAKATLHIDGRKRSILVRFHEPLTTGEDPTADLIVALERRSAPGLLIPQLRKDDWDPSHPERHTELITGGGPALWRTRRYVIRLAKAWNNLQSKPPLCSFNIEVLAYEAVEARMGVAEALEATLRHGATTLPAGLTKDPAGVSGTIGLPHGKDHAVRRLTKAADELERMLDSPNDEELVRDGLAALFPGLVSPPASSKSLAGFANALRGGNDRVSVTAGGLTVATTGRTIKTTGAFGDGT
jgi:hypothetical protein